MKLPSEDYVEIAEKVRTGEYFREARSLYDLSVHDPMSERYLYVFITAISILILVIAQIARDGLYPLNKPVPFIYSANDIVEDVPRMTSLVAFEGESSNEALLRFMCRHYVVVREEYDISTFDRDVNSVKSQSSEDVFKEFQQVIDPRNPESPLTLYQRHSKRKITVLSSRHVQDQVEVVFEAVVEGRNEIKKSYWRANIAFQYSGIGLDEKGQFIPLRFVITKYNSNRLQDIK